MDSSQHLKSVGKTLDAMQALNMSNGMTVADMVRVLSTPRTTAYRILETLSELGYVRRDPLDNRYRLTRKVVELSNSFASEESFIEIARPLLEETCRDLVWPLSISTARGLQMVVRATTDHLSPHTLTPTKSGYEIPLLKSAAGIVWLAYSDEWRRATMLSQITTMQLEAEEYKRIEKSFDHLMKSVHSRGYHIVMNTSDAEAVISVPIMSGGQLAGCLGLRFFKSALDATSAIATLVPPLRDAAARMGGALEEANRD